MYCCLRWSPIRGRDLMNVCGVMTPGVDVAVHEKIKACAHTSGWVGICAYEGCFRLQLAEKKQEPAQEPRSLECTGRCMQLEGWSWFKQASGRLAFFISAQACNVVLGALSMDYTRVRTRHKILPGSNCISCKPPHSQVLNDTAWACAP